MSQLWLYFCVASCFLGKDVMAQSAWPAWDGFRQLYVTSDGRVVDKSTPAQITTSEGQAYAAFFALVANDRDGFAALLSWTQNNLSGGDLTQRLPAWKWGRDEEGRWRVLDSNSASDADLWLVYALGEAGVLWCESSYVTLARSIAERIRREEVAFDAGLGPTLLPGPRGFVMSGVWRLNASYSPLFLLRRVQQLTAEGLWYHVIKSSRRVIEASAPHGFAADWVRYQSDTGFGTDTVTKGVGSYDAIRVYLWAGMLAASDSARADLFRLLAPMRAHAVTSSTLPERIDTASLTQEGTAPYGFSAAVVPLLEAMGERKAARAHLSRARSEALRSGDQYYSDVLALFGMGWVDSYFHFGRDGQLEVGWRNRCRRAH